jgi:hypothetical protein
MEAEEDSILEIKYLDNVLRHIQLVQQNCIIVGKKLIEDGKTQLGRALIQNSLKHDNSKLSGTEWDYIKIIDKKLNKVEKAGLAFAVQQHAQTNPHHPEYWGTIHEMPEVYVIEMVCDWLARANEFGTDLREWIAEEATKRFGFSSNDPVYDMIFKYVNMLCKEPFKKISPEK